MDAKVKIHNRPRKPHDVADFWDWDVRLAECNEALSKFVELVPKLKDWIADSDTTDTERECYQDLIRIAQNRIEWLRDQIRICEDWKQKTMDFDKAIDILKKAFDEGVMQGWSGYTNIVRSEGLLHKQTLKNAIRSIGCQLRLLENHEDGDTFFMRYPIERLDLMDYIENIQDAD